MSESPPVPPADRTTDAVALIEQIRRRADVSVHDALAMTEQAIERHGERGDLVYLLAEINARLGRSHEALDLIDRAVLAHEAAGDELGAQRCEVGRIIVLDDLGRHDEAIAAATSVLLRLRDRATARSNGGDAGSIDPELAETTVRALSNRALCWESIGAYEAAHDDYEDALRIDAAAIPPILVAQLQINRSNVLDLLGRSADAIEALQLALPLLEELGEREDVVKVAANLGAMSCRRGEFDAGLGWLAVAERDVEAGTVDACAIQVETAEAYAGFGALDEAVHRYREAIEVLADTPISWLEGRAWLGLGITLARRGDDENARRALRTALDAFQASDNLPLAITALLELAAVESADPTMHVLAVDQVRRAVSLADVDRWPVQACLAQLRLAELDSGAEGERLLRSALRLAERAELAPLTMRAHQRLGRHLLSRGRPRDARPHVESAVELAETLRSRLPHHSLLRLFPAETASCYDDLVALRLVDGDVAGAARAADRGRSRSLLDRLGPRSGGDPEVAALELELDVLYDRVLGAGVETVSDRERLERRVRELEHELERRRVRLDAVDPGATVDAGDAGGDPTAAGVDGARTPNDGAEPVQGAARPAGQVVVMFHAESDRLGAFVIERDGTTTWCPGLADRREVAEEIERFHADGRRTWAMRSAGLAPSDAASASARRRLERLGSMLLGSLWTAVRRHTAPDEIIDLVVVPTGGLWAVPFTALVVDGVAVIDVAQVTVAPSPTVARTRPPVANGPALVVGVPGLGVPGAAVEAREIASLHAGATLFVDHQATLDRVRLACSSATAPSVVHLATHGVHRPHAPLQSGVRLADAWLTSHRASALHLDGSLVVLSACDTGRSTVTDGDEILGAQYGFLAAGARAVVMSLWPAHDVLTVDLMGEFHRRLASGGSAASSLRGAQLALREVEPHPWWWASFAISGGA